MVNDIAINLKLDLTRNRGTEVIYARQSDTKVHNLRIILTNNGKVVDISTAVACIMYIKKPNGTEYANGMVRTGNELSYTLRTEDIDIVGETKGQVYIELKDGSKITSPAFAIQVFSNILDATLNQITASSENKYQGILDTLADTQEALEKAETLAESGLTYYTTTKEYYDKAVVYEKELESEREEVSANTAASKSYKESALASATSASNSEVNAKSYMDKAKEYEEASEKAIKVAGIGIFTVEDDGYLYLTTASSSEDDVTFSINEDGILEVEIDE